jgi:hypothetical protein
MGSRTGFGGMLRNAALILVATCAAGTIGAVAYDQGPGRRHSIWRQNHTPVGVEVAATNGFLIGLAIGSAWALFLGAAWLWGGKRDGLRDLQRALEQQADHAHRDGRLAEEQRLRREIADIVRDRGRPDPR